MGGSSSELLESLSQRVSDVVARSAVVTRRSTLLVQSSRQLRSEDPLIARCAWCERVRVAGAWVLEPELPQFLRNALRAHESHGICPDCRSHLEHEGQSAVAGTAVVVRAREDVAIDRLRAALQDYEPRPLAALALEVRLRDPGTPAMNALLSKVSSCLAEYRLAPVAVELGDRRYVLGG